MRTSLPAIAIVVASLMAGAQRPATSVEPPAPIGAVPSARQLAWHERQFYGFIHFTVNTFTDKEWGYGDEAESVFNPTALDARQWARVARDAGMKGLIITAKHHDGFALWPSKFTEHSVKGSPWKSGKGDVVGELAAACKEYGLAFGVYLSPWDRNHADYGRPAYLDYYRSQLRELLTSYGPIAEVWFDGANGGDGYYGGARERRKIDGATYYDWPNTWKLVRELQPQAMMFSDVGPDVRWVGNEKGVAFETSWNPITLDGFYPGHPKYTQIAAGSPDGKDWVPPEVDVSIRPGLVLPSRGGRQGGDGRQARRDLRAVGRPRRQPAAQHSAGSPRADSRRRRRTAARAGAADRRDLQGRPRARARRRAPIPPAARPIASPPRASTTATRRPTGRQTTGSRAARSRSNGRSRSAWTASSSRRRLRSASASSRGRSPPTSAGPGPRSPRGRRSATSGSRRFRR